MRLLQRKQISVSAGSIKDALITAYFVDQQPVWLDMQLPVRLPTAFKSMISQLGREVLFIEQKQNNRFQLVCIVASLLRLSQISPKLRGKSCCSHLNSQLPEKVCRILRMMKSFAPFNGFQSLTGFLIGNLRSERQALFSGNLGQHHAAGIGNRQPHPRQHGGGFPLNGGIDTGTNIIIGRHSVSPSFIDCSSLGHNVKPAGGVTYGRF